jgi:hypothetical protein
MLVMKTLVAGGAALLVSLSGDAFAEMRPACKAPTPGSSRAPLVSPPIEYAVVGAGGLPFYSAPDVRCPMPGVFVIPKDRLVVYVITDDGWAQTTYFGGVNPSGWVRFGRLKDMGAMGPKQ